MSDSESEEDIDRLKVAVDPHFASCFNVKGQTDESYPVATSKGRGPDRRDVSVQQTTSFRHHVNADNNYGNLGTTPEFRAHVAKKLGEIIDRKIKLTDIQGDPVKMPESVSTHDGGIRLFATSSVFTDTEHRVDASKQRRRHVAQQKRKKFADNSSSSSDEMEKLASVAVSADWVLSKKGLYGENEPTQGIIKDDKCCPASLESSTPTLVENGKQGGRHRNVCRKKKKKRKKRKHSDESGKHG